MEKKIFGILLVGGILVWQLTLLRKLVVPTKKGIVDKLAMVIGTPLLIGLTYRFASVPVDYVFAVLGLAVVFVMIFKQGITKDGFTMNARGHEMYQWSEVDHVNIVETDQIKVTYFSKTGSPIISQKFSLKNKDKLYGILEKNVKIL